MTRIGLSIVAILLAIVGVYAVFRALDQRAAPPIVIEDASIAQTVTVDVRGAVNTPGVYELPPGARVQDAVAAAGGLSAGADLSTINLARRLRDGEVLIISVLPRTNGSPAAPTGVQNASNSEAGAHSRVNINTATAAELEALPEIGEVTAEKIIAFREANGPFHSVDDLVQIPGISSRTVESLRDLVTTGP
jgi:competence protein ComEA